MEGMAGTIAAVLSLAYILGLFATAIPGRVLGIPNGGWVVLLIGVIAAASLPRYWRTGATRGIYLLAGVVGLVACLYLQWRTPSPLPTDISHTVSTSDSDRPTIVVVDGRVTSTPRLTRSSKRQFWLEATRVSETRGQDTLSGQPVTGNVYVTVPSKAIKELYPGDSITVRGVLYHPKPAANPGGFDFQAYLRDHGCFTGLRGWQVERNDHPPLWGWWMVRRRIINAQARWLDEPEAALVSAMVIGGRTVDLPYNVKDAFARTGLAHALAASGFQVSLILSVVIALTQRFSSRVQFVGGLIALGTFIGLTGLQPAVMRAAVMGVGALVALVMERQVRPLGSLLLAATVLLLWQPLWIWDLGFQLSLLATLGLMVTVAPLTQWLDWLPTPIASSISVPIAAYLWTIPLQLLAFGVVSPYSIPVNVVTTPLIVIISLGAFISAVASLAMPIVGSALAWTLYWPTHWLMQIVQWTLQLPGNGIATGRITLWQLLMLYGLLCLVWWQSNYKHQPQTSNRKRPFRLPTAVLLSITVTLGCGLVMLPAWYTASQLVRATVMAAANESVLVWQERGQVGIIGDPSPKTVDFTVVPFLQAQGINRLHWALALDPVTPTSGWSAIAARLPIASLYHAPNMAAVTRLPALQQIFQQALTTGNSVHFGSITIRPVMTAPLILTLQLGSTTWLWLGKLPHAQQVQLATANTLPTAQVVWWSGDSLAGSLLKRVQPKWAIATAPQLQPDTRDRLRKRHIQLLWLTRDGAIQWTPVGFALNSTEGDSQL